MKVITIGRSTENNDIVVNDEKVSRNHLQMVMDDNGNYSVVDLGSTNGTYVNGQRISGEVRLQLSDEVRIGQTVLPWQNYFPASPQPATKDYSMSPRPPKPEPNRTWLYVIIGAALLLLIGGGVAWKVYNNKQKEKVEQQKKEEDAQMKQEADEARIAAAKLSAEAARLSEEAEKAARKAAETDSEKDKAIAKEMRVKADEANQLARQKEEEWKNMKKELDAANKAKVSAEQEAEQAQEDAKKAKEAQAEAVEEANKARQAQKEAEKEVQLTKQFYRLISQVQPSIWAWKENPFQTIINELNWTVNEDEDKKEFIINRFETGNDDQKRRIINAVEKVLGQQKKEAAVAKPVEGNTPVSTKEPESNTNDTIVKE